MSGWLCFIQALPPSARLEMTAIAPTHKFERPSEPTVLSIVSGFEGRRRVGNYAPCRAAEAAFLPPIRVQQCGLSNMESSSEQRGMFSHKHDVVLDGQLFKNGTRSLSLHFSNY